MIRGKPRPMRTWTTRGRTHLPPCSNGWKITPFPILLAAEWGQEGRLLKRLDEPTVSPALKAKIIAQLGDMFSTEAVPRLLVALKDPDVTIATAAAQALGTIGQKESIAALIDVLKTGSPELQAAAAKGLGQVGALHGDFSIIPPCWTP